MSTPAPVPPITPYSTQRLLPLSHSPLSQPTAAPLSLLDNSVLRFAIASGTWTFSSSPSTEHLLLSLRHTLDSYPHFAGQLQRTPSCLAQTSGNAAGLEVVYGREKDPGVEVVLARCERRLDEVVPSAEERNAGGTWDATHLGPMGWHSTEGLALKDRKTSEGRPALIVQLTTFACGGLAVALTFAHSLADADTLTQFTRDWSRFSSALLHHSPLPALKPTFNPQAIDSLAGSSPDPDLLELAKSAPLHRYDWEAPNPLSSSAPWVASESVPLESFKKIETKWRGQPIPWDEWDMGVPAKRLNIFFSPKDIEGMAKEAQATARGRVSKLDALLAHLWRVNLRARSKAGVAVDEAKGVEEVFLDMSMGARTRFDPPLPPTTLGSPIFNAPVTYPSPEAVLSASLGDLATSIRTEVSRYDGSLMVALLHEWKHLTDGDSTRRWDTFLGRRHLLVTSWLRTGSWEVDFGSGGPRDFWANMPICDGCVCLTDAKPDEGQGERWHERGAGVDLCLREDVVRALLEDPELRRFG